MNQLNATSLFGTQNPLDNVLNSSGKSATTADFQNALSAALSATLREFGIDPNQVTISVAPAASAAARVTPFSAASTASSPAATVAVPVNTAAVAPATTAATGNSSEASNQSLDDAYWAKQPQAVQALRNINDYDQRMKLASDLSAQGYNIDVPIMAWGWDPAKITAARQSYGYTWVPSGSQNPIAEAPGVSQPGTKSYDPNKAPAGSMAV